MPRTYVQISKAEWNEVTDRLAELEAGQASLDSAVAGLIEVVGEIQEDNDPLNITQKDGLYHISLEAAGINSETLAGEWPITPPDEPAATTVVDFQESPPPAGGLPV